MQPFDFWLPDLGSNQQDRCRPIGLLRQWHTRIEAWILEQAGITLDAVVSADVIPLRTAE